MPEQHQHGSTMNRRRFVAALGGVVLIGVAATVVGVRRSFRNQIDRERDELLAAARLPAIRTVDESHLTDLPAPVQRWLRTAGVVGSVVPSIVRLTQQGEFRLGAGESWMPFHAIQHYTIDPPGFLWEVSMRMLPLIDIDGRDRYFAGQGDIEMRLGSVYPVARASGENLDNGALLRYLNETMWFPAALVLPNVSWEAIDDRHARATLTDTGRSVSAVFIFDDGDRLIDMTAERWNDTEQAVLPWSTPLSDWGVFEGISIPVAGTGRWGEGADAYDYIRPRITGVTYDVGL
ncbi:MAG: hypothetical protein IT339_01125 [Thermomicrobiales bacterium]|nr:hypothetical protein [Thermomicrobiales bacterium]